MTAGRASRERSPWEYRRRLWVAAVMAMAVHGVVYFTSRPPVFVAAQFGTDDGAVSVEVELIEQAPAPAQVEPTPEPMPKPDDVVPTIEERQPEPSEPPKPARTRPPAPVRPQAGRVTKPASDVVRGITPGAPKGGITSGATALYSPVPIYPAESRAAGEQGSVLLVAGVDATGRVTSVSIRRSSGFPRLDRAAQEAFRSYKLKPAMRNGQPMASKVEKSFRFSAK